MPIFVLSEKISFPPARLASEEGLLAVGGDLAPERILTAYRAGIFPWYAEGQPILWWSPDPRLVLFPSRFKMARSLRKTIRQEKFQVTADQAFDQVIRQCACAPRARNDGTWLMPEMIQAYGLLHRYGFAHSVEAWYEGELAGGLYGIALGRCFFGESMFTRISNASKVALAFLMGYLKTMDYQLVDCQVKTQHLMRLGAEEIPRSLFLKQLKESLTHPTQKGPWIFSE